jgi:hypothetical protein
VVFTDGTSGAQLPRVDSAALTFNATTNTLTVTSSNATQALSSSFATTASFAVTSSFATSASYALSASFASTVGSIANNITNNVDNRILTAGGVASTINGESNLTFDGTTLTVTGNTTITGDLSVAGTASFINTDNLTIKDKFILINSGSTTLADSGWITQYNTAGSGSAFYLEAGSAGSTGVYGRFAMAYDVTGTTTTPTPNNFVVSVTSSTGIPLIAPTWGGNTTGYGNMYVNSSDESIWVYS